MITEQPLLLALLMFELRAAVVRVVKCITQLAFAFRANSEAYQIVTVIAPTPQHSCR